MSGVLKRLKNIARSYVSQGVGGLTGEKKDRGTLYREYDSPFFEREFSDENLGGENAYFKASGTNASDSAFPNQVIEDLSVFGLKPPSSLAEVRRARNREMKKYHSDKFINDSEKREISKEIMQIYNAAYERLSAYYEKK